MTVSLCYTKIVMCSQTDWCTKLLLAFMASTSSSMAPAWEWNFNVFIRENLNLEVELNTCLIAMIVYMIVSFFFLLYILDSLLKCTATFCWNICRRKGSHALAACCFHLSAESLPQRLCSALAQYNLGPISWGKPQALRCWQVTKSDNSGIEVIHKIKDVKHRQNTWNKINRTVLRSKASGIGLMLSYTAL